MAAYTALQRTFGAHRSEPKMIHRMLLATAGLAISLDLVGTQAQASTYDLTLAGDATAFSEANIDFDHLHFDQFSITLSGLNSDNAITVSEGDMINSTVTLNQAYTIPGSMVRTDILQFLTGSSFPNENTGVAGTFDFYNGGTLVETFAYDSTTSNSLASFAAVFPPSNGPLTFTSFTNDFTITSLASPATLDGSSFTYDLVSNIPEPAAWATMLMGVFGLGGMLRARRKAGYGAVAIAKR